MPFGFKTVRELVADQQIQIRDLESRVKAIESEWDDTYDRMTRKAARERKRLRDEASAEAANGQPTLGQPGADADRLPPRIAARRRGLLNHGLHPDSNSQA